MVFNNVFGAFRRLLPGGSTPTDERREIVRVNCKLPASCEIGSEKISVTVVDMGLRGLRIESPKRLGKGRKVTVSRPNHGGPVECKVVWSSARRFAEVYQAGLQFTDTVDNMRKSWIKGTLQQLGFSPGRIKEKRKHIRLPAEQRAAIQNSSGDILTDGVVINLGIGGALIALDIEVAKTVPVVLVVDPLANLEPLEMPSEIRSCYRPKNSRQYLHGLRFHDQDNDLVKRYLAVLLKGH